MFFRRKKQTVPPPIAVRHLENRVIPGVPDLMTGQDTTYARMRGMATHLRDEGHRNDVELGLALSILAIIDDFERHLQEDMVDLNVLGDYAKAVELTQNMWRRPTDPYTQYVLGPTKPQDFDG